MLELISAKLFFMVASSGFLGVCFWAEPVILVVDATASVMMREKERQEREKNNTSFSNTCCIHKTVQRIVRETPRSCDWSIAPLIASPRPRASTAFLISQRRCKPRALHALWASPKVIMPPRGKITHCSIPPKLLNIDIERHGGGQDCFIIEDRWCYIEFTVLYATVIPNMFIVTPSHSLVNKRQLLITGDWQSQATVNNSNKFDVTQMVGLFLCYTARCHQALT